MASRRSLISIEVARSSSLSRSRAIAQRSRYRAAACGEIGWGSQPCSHCIEGGNRAPNDASKPVGSTLSAITCRTIGDGGRSRADAPRQGSSNETQWIGNPIHDSRANRLFADSGTLNPKIRVG